MIQIREYTTKYYYVEDSLKRNESGNRIRKIVIYDKGITFPETITDEFYVRDISGREIAIYNNLSNSLEYWNIWAGSELIGRINPNSENDRYYYLKDHLGTIRAVLDNGKNIVFAQDYDIWGYLLENRTSGKDDIKNKFTGKERDKETTYDYFGARYYDSRIGRWGTTEPLYDKYLSFSPYNYGVNNPLSLKDINGNDVIVTIDGNTITFTANIYYRSFEKYKNKRTSLSESQISYYKENLDNAFEQWSDIKSIEYNGKKYEVSFKLNFKEAETFEENNIFTKVFNEGSYEGNNIALPSENENGDPRIENGNILIFPNIEGKSGYSRYWYSHEFGHLVGLKHNVQKYIRFSDYDIMGYAIECQKPSVENLLKLMKIIDVNKSSQTIRGATEDY